MEKYISFRQMRDSLIKKEKRFDGESLKMIRYGDLDLAGIGNALEAACDFSLIDSEKERRMEAIKNLPINEVEADKEYRDSPYLRDIYRLIPEVIEEGIVPVDWVKAVKCNANKFDGHMNDGRIMRDGTLQLPDDVYKEFGLKNNNVSGNIAKMLGATPTIHNGYRGSYEELFETILTPEQKIIFLQEKEE